MSTLNDSAAVPSHLGADAPTEGPAPRRDDEELSADFGVPRVDVIYPDLSLLLTMPLLEDPPDEHPNAAFQSAYDEDYLTILNWIREGAHRD